MPALLPSSVGQVLTDFVAAFDNVQSQLKGANQAVVPLTDISTLGTDGISILKKHLEDSTRTQFAFAVDAGANSVILMPTGPMSKATLAGPKSSAGKPVTDKVPRPPNAFIIYRKEWHPKIVEQNPTLHNNKISVIIGDQWRAESDEVKERYKVKAEDAKRQHLINHPDYQYQPRKPSEKKKRMTKNKIAKLAAAEAQANINDQQQLPDDFDPLTLLDDALEAAAAITEPAYIDTYSTPYTQSPPALSQQYGGAGTVFNTGPDPDDALRKVLDDYNNSRPILPGTNTQPPFSTVICAPTAANGVTGTPSYNLPNVEYTTDVGAITAKQWAKMLEQHDGPPETDTTLPGLFYKGQATGPHPARSAPYFDPMAKVHRRARLESELGTYFDIDGATLSSSRMTSPTAEPSFDMIDEIEKNMAAAEAPFTVNPVSTGFEELNFDDYAAADATLPTFPGLELDFADLVNMQD